MYKANLSILNERYSEYERCVLEVFAENPAAETIHARRRHKVRAPSYLIRSSLRSGFRPRSDHLGDSTADRPVSAPNKAATTHAAQASNSARPYRFRHLTWSA
jgi:hypothetical protein